MNVLFVTWDGPEVNYLESLFAPIFARLQQSGMRFHVLQFTWADRTQVARVAAACEALGIGYRSVKVFRRPKALGAVLGALWGSGVVRAELRRRSIDVVLPRSTLPGLAVLLGMPAGSARLVFDADGLPLDERVDFAGESATSPVQRVLRDVEAQLVRRAEVVLTRSARANEVLLARAGAGTSPAKFRVVGNPRDAERFQPFHPAARAATRASIGVPGGAPLLVYTGSIGPQYCPEEMFRFFAAVVVRRPDARMLVLTPRPALVAAAMSAAGVPAASVLVRSVPGGEVPEYLACADLGIALRRRTFSMQAVAPIKLGEYLLCGLPVLATDGIGDTRAFTRQVACLLDGDGALDRRAAVDWFVDVVLADREGFRVRCRALGEAHFSLDACVAAYARALGGADDAD